MVGNIQTIALVIFADPHRQDEANAEAKDRRGERGPDGNRADADQLDNKLAAEGHVFVITDAAKAGAYEQCKQQAAEHPADAVHGEYIEAIIYLETIFY